METEMIAVLVLLAAMGCLALSIYKVKEWYRKNTRTADPDACEQEKVNLKMMEQARQREQVIKPEPPPDGYTEIAAPFGGHGLMDLKNMLLAVLLFVFYGLAVEYTGTHPFLNGGEKLFIVFLLRFLRAARPFGYIAGCISGIVYTCRKIRRDGCVQLVLGRRFFLCIGSRLIEAAYPCVP
ncbi:MAG: hypothetical protein ACLRP4_08490 [Dialister invisus]